MVSISRGLSRSATESEARHQRQQAKQSGQGQRARGTRQVLPWFRGCALLRRRCRLWRRCRRLSGSRSRRSLTRRRRTERRDVHLGDLQTLLQRIGPGRPLLCCERIRPFQRAADLDGLVDVLLEFLFVAPHHFVRLARSLGGEQVAGAGPAPLFAWMSTNSSLRPKPVLAGPPFPASVACRYSLSRITQPTRVT